MLAAVVLPDGPRPRHGPRPVRRGLAGRREGAGLPRGGRASRPTRRPRPSPRSRLDIDTRRWAGRAVLPARRQAAGPAGHRDRGRVQAGPAPAVHRHGDRGARPERARDPGPARRGHHDAVRLQGPGHRDGDPRRHDGLRLRRLVHRVQPRGLRAADPRRAARRSAAVPPARGGRAVLEDPRPDRGLLGPQTASPTRTRPAAGGRSPPTSSCAATAAPGGDRDRRPVPNTRPRPSRKRARRAALRRRRRSPCVRGS